LLEVQYRAPLKTHMIEFPSFLNDFDDAQKSALNGLKVFF